MMKTQVELNFKGFHNCLPLHMKTLALVTPVLKLSTARLCTFLKQIAEMTRNCKIMVGKYTQTSTIFLTPTMTRSLTLDRVVNIVYITLHRMAEMLSLDCVHFFFVQLSMKVCVLTVYLAIWKSFGQQWVGHFSLC